MLTAGADYCSNPVTLDTKTTYSLEYSVNIDYVHTVKIDEVYDEVRHIEMGRYPVQKATKGFKPKIAYF